MHTTIEQRAKMTVDMILQTGSLRSLPMRVILPYTGGERRTVSCMRTTPSTLSVVHSLGIQVNSTDARAPRERDKTYTGGNPARLIFTVCPENIIMLDSRGAVDMNEKNRRESESGESEGSRSTVTPYLSERGFKCMHGPNGYCATR
jgi:hypothetical protein